MAVISYQASLFAIYAKMTRSMKFYNQTCLLVNGNQRDRDIFGTVLKDCLPRMLYFIASDGEEALSMILKDEIIPDVIFIESELPVMGGLEFLKRIKREPTCRDIPVMVRVKSRESNQIKAIQAEGAAGIYAGQYRYENVYNLLFIYQLPELILMHSN